MEFVWIIYQSGSARRVLQVSGEAQRVTKRRIVVRCKHARTPSSTDTHKSKRRRRSWMSWRGQSSLSTRHFPFQELATNPFWLIFVFEWSCWPVVEVASYWIRHVQASLIWGFPILPILSSYGEKKKLNMV